MGKSIEVLVRAVVEAKGRYGKAKVAEEAAYRERVAALEGYNVAAKELDQAIAELKQGAPQGTEWHDGKR